MGFASIILAAVALVTGISQTHSLQRPDGSDIVYHLGRDEGAASQPLLLLMQGSGCDPAAANERLTGFGPILAPGHATLTIEKYGVPPAEAAKLIEGCTDAYWQGNTLQQRVMDAARVVGHLRGEPWWNGELILFGGSEGGAVVAMLAPLVPETRAVIVYSSGIGVPVGDLIRQAIPPPAAAEAVRIFADAKANPTGDKRWGGASYRWWAESIDVVPALSLLQTDAPILLIHGSRDQWAPVATARATRDLFAARGETNLTYREYEGYDHFMKDSAGGDHQREVLNAAADWLRGLDTE